MRPYQPRGGGLGVLDNVQNFVFFFFDGFPKSSKGPFTDGSTKHFLLPIFYFYPVSADFLILCGKWVLL